MDAESDKMTDTSGPISVTWALLTALVGVTVYWALSRRKPRYSSHNIPPFPAPKKFLIGHLHLWAGKDVLDTIQTFREKVGDVFSVDLAGNLIVVINGYENIKETLTQHYTKAPDRPTPAQIRYVNEDNHGVLHSKGKNWKVQRTTSQLILRAFGMGKNIVAEKILEEVAVYTDKLASFDDNPVDINVLTNISVSNVICSIIVGKRFDHDDPHFVQLMGNLDYLCTKGPTLALLESIPFIKYLPGDVFGIKIWVKNIIEINENFSKAQITDVRKTFSPTGEPTNFITAYLQKMLQENAKSTESYLDEANLISNIRGLFLAGTETTSSTIYWCVLLCLHHPEVQDRMFEEISAHVGHDRLPNMADRPNLRYVEAVIRESQRYTNLVAVLTREVVEDFDLCGHTIPKGATVALNMKSILFDDKTWGDPHQFRPERFLDATGNLVYPDELLPFGLGRRVCLGEAMAKMELFLFLSAMFQRFRFEPETPGQLPSLKGKLSIVQKPKPYKVRIVPRRPSN